MLNPTAHGWRSRELVAVGIRYDLWLHVLRNQPLLSQKMNGGTIEPSLTVRPKLEERSSYVLH